jgi:hypothetical protein
MGYKSFESFFPEIAEKETRTITIKEQNDTLPADCYCLVELYCDEPGCDCRRVILYVISFDTEKKYAVINFGWESKNFYKKWIDSDDEEIIEDFKGPVLEPLSEQSEYAFKILDIVENVILRDKKYIERLKRHYELFKSKIDERIVVLNSGISRNSLCPCGSDKKYKRCCGK